MKKRNVIAVALFAMVAVSSSSIASAQPQPAKDSKQPTAQFLAPEKAPAISSLKGAQVLSDVHKDIDDNIAADNVTVAYTTDGFWEGNVYYRFDRYSETSNQIDWDTTRPGSSAKQRGLVRVDNRAYPVTTHLNYTQQTSGSHEISVTGSFEVTAGVKWAIIGKAEVTAGIELAYTRQWSTSTEVEDGMDVPGGKVGYDYCYNPGVASAGYAIYKGYFLDYDTEYVGETSKALSAKVPSDTTYNFRHVLADS